MANQGWKIDKHIPVAVILAFLAQAVIYGIIAVWVASKYDSRLTVLEEFKVRSVAEREKDGQRIKGIEMEIPVIREKMQNIEKTTDRIEKKIDKLSLNWSIPAHALREAGGNPHEAMFYLSLKELGEVRCS